MIAPSPVRLKPSADPCNVEGDPQRWQQMQRLRRGQEPVAAWLEGLLQGELEPAPDLLAALWGRLDRSSVERLLAAAVGLDPTPWMVAARRELPLIAAEFSVVQAWLEPLLEHQATVDPTLQRGWLEVLAHFQDPRVAQRLRAVVLKASRGPWAPDTWTGLLPLLPLLGRQRQHRDAVLLLQCCLDPGPLAWRQAALEGVALGLSAWPLPLLRPALLRLAQDLDPVLAAGAVDLLARLPNGQRPLRQLAALDLDPNVAARVQRRLQLSPMVLVVHGRQGGDIPSAYGELAEELSRRRGAPVVVQALTAALPSVDGSFWRQAQRAGALTVVPLLLLPGEHVRRDVPQLTAAWGSAAGDALPDAPRPALRRIPFLGAWPQWQRQLADQLHRLAAGRPWCWVHHPLQGALAQRYLTHLGRHLGRAGVPAAEADQPLQLPPLAGPSALVVPLALAPNRMAESLNMDAAVPQGWEVLPPLLGLPAMRSVLLDRLEAEP